VDARPLEVVGRLLLCAGYLERAILGALEPFGPSLGDFASRSHRVASALSPHGRAPPCWRVISPGLKREAGDDMHVIGSPELVPTLLEEGRVDELRLLLSRSAGEEGASRGWRPSAPAA
jgi:hypothetical protein